MRPPKKTNWLYHGGSVALLGMFGLAYVAYWIPPETAWWVQLLAVGLPILVALLMLWSLGLVWQRAWGWLTVMLVAIGLYVMRYELFVRWPIATPEQDTLVIMTYNIPASHRLDLGDSLVQLVTRYQPQLIGFQEVGIWWYRHAHAQRLLRLIAHLQPLVQHYGYQPPKTDFERGPLFAEVVTLTRLPVLAQQIRPLAYGPEGLIYQAVRSELCWEGRPFVHYNVRLQSYGPIKPWEVLRNGGWKHWATWRRWLGAYRRAILQRAQQVRQLRIWIAQETLPVIVSGDLNSTSDQWFYGHLARGLRSGGSLRGFAAPSWPAAHPLVRIDHVLVSREWDVLEETIPAARLSDHRPVIARLHWRQPPGYAEACVADASMAQP